jgi:hypothetical protein
MEYLQSIRERHCAKGRTENTIKVGDVVIVHSDDHKCILWNLAIVGLHRLNYGNDGLVRSAQIKTKMGFTNRPINKLYPLETVCNEIPSIDNKDKDNRPTPTAESVKPVDGTKCPTRKAALEARNKIK